MPVDSPKHHGRASQGQESRRLDLRQRRMHFRPKEPVTGRLWSGRRVRAHVKYTFDVRDFSRSATLSHEGAEIATDIYG
jgi:hypothetical protein